MRYLSTVSLVLVAVVYVPLLNSYFSADDFHNISDAAECGWSASCLTAPFASSHWSPFLRVVFAAEWTFFGTDARLYYIVNIFLHLAVSVLGGSFFAKVLDKKWMLPLFILVYGLSFAHWRVPMWITTQGQMFAALFLLLSLLALYYWRQSRSRVFLLGALCSHLLAMVSFTTGIMFFFVTFVFFLLYAHGGELHKNYKAALLYSIPFLLTTITYVLVRGQFIDSNVSALIVERGVYTTAIESVKSFLGGFVQGFLGNYTGITPVASKLFGAPLAWPFVLLISCVAVVIFVPIERIRRKDNKDFLIAIGLLASGAALYILPIVPRLELGYEFFVSRSRYLYVPGLFVAAALCYRIGVLYEAVIKNNLSFEKLFLVGIMSLILVVNSGALVVKGLSRKEDTNRFKEEAEGFVRNARQLAELNEQMCILDKAFSKTFAGWNAKPTYLMAMYGVRPLEEKVHVLHDQGQVADCLEAGIRVLP